MSFKFCFNKEESTYTSDFLSMFITAEDISVYSDRCYDLSLSVRKQSLSGLTDLVIARPTDEAIQVQ